MVITSAPCSMSSGGQPLGGGVPDVAFQAAASLVDKAEKAEIFE
nr:hypothetical protein [Kibdelosporangium sp. MJ126-NF4]